MSGTVQSADLVWGLRALLAANTEGVSQQVDTLTAESSTGLIAQTYGGLAEGGRVAFDVQPQVDRLTAVQQGIDAASGPLNVAQDALQQIGSLAANLVANLNDTTVLTTAEVPTLAADARDGLARIAGLLDTQYAGQYVFAGQDSANAPIPDPNDIGSSAFAGQIATAVSTLGASAATVESRTLAIAGPGGTSPFSASLETLAGGPGDPRTQIEVEIGERWAGAPLANKNGDVASGGTDTTGSYTRDILRAFATVASFTESSANAAGFGQLVTDTQASLRAANAALNEDAGVLGDRQTALTNRGSLLAATATTLSNQVNNVEDADLAQVSTSLSLAQTKLQASYQLIANLGKLSLVNYL